MTEMAALAYGVLASFVMASLTRNKRERRRNPPTLTLFSWLLLSFSGAFGLMLLGLAAYKVFGAA